MLPESPLACVRASGYASRIRTQKQDGVLRVCPVISLFCPLWRLGRFVRRKSLPQRPVQGCLRRRDGACSSVGVSLLGFLLGDESRHRKTKPPGSTRQLLAGPARYQAGSGQKSIDHVAEAITGSPQNIERKRLAFAAVSWNTSIHASMKLDPQLSGRRPPLLVDSASWAPVLGLPHRTEGTGEQGPGSQTPCSNTPNDAGLGLSQIPLVVSLVHRSKNKARLRNLEPSFSHGRSVSGAAKKT